MHIEINATGQGGSLAISEYQLNMISFVSSADSLISSFKTIMSETYGLSGGVDNLQEAIEDVQGRIIIETQRKESAVEIQTRSNDFIDLAKRVDQQVSILVDKNRDEFYQVNPWLKPPPDPSEKAWYEKAWDWVCETGQAIGEGLKATWEWTKDSLKKAWDGIVDFYEEHKNIIKAIATVLLIVAAIAVIVLVPPAGGLLATMAIGASWGVIAGAAIGGVSGGIQSKANGGSFWDGCISGAFSGAIGGMVAGAAMGGLGFAGQALGHSISSLSAIGKAIQATSTVTKVLSLSMTAFDTVALADLIIDPGNNPLYDFNKQAHSSSVYNTAQIGISALAAFTGGMSSTMQSPTPQKHVSVNDPDFSDSDYQTIREYVSPDNYKEINESYYNSDLKLSSSHQEIDNNLSRILDNSSLPEPTVKYRGTNTIELGTELEQMATSYMNDPNGLQNALQGKTYIKKGYMSTGSKDLASSYRGNMIVEVRSSSGTHALDVSLPGSPGSEYLHQVNTSLTIRSAQWIKSGEKNVLSIIAEVIK